jgi:hypothetical protein
MAPPAAALTALTASTNLCVLQLDLSLARAPTGPHHAVLFGPGTVYPRLRLIELQCGGTFGTHMPICEQQLQQLCSSCSALESLEVELCQGSSLTAWLPLLQLSALTQLKLRVCGTAAAASAVGVEAQLTSLKQLVIQAEPGPQWRLAVPTLLQLTALTALEHLEMMAGGSRPIYLKSKVRGCVGGVDQYQSALVPPVGQLMLGQLMPHMTYDFITDEATGVRAITSHQPVMAPKSMLAAD